MRHLFQGLSPVNGIACCQILLMLNIFCTANGWFALTNILELVLWFVVLISGVVRRAVFSLVDTRVYILLGFIFWIAVAMSWGDASLGERLEELASWRKVVLFPIALAIFDTRESRLMFLRVFIFWVLVYSLASWMLYLAGDANGIDPASLLENDVVQAIFFAFAALSLFTLWMKGDFSANPLVLGLIVFILASNVFVVATGRSGYLFLVIGIMVTIWYMADRHRIKIMVSLLLLVIAGFMVSDRPSSTLMQGINEVLSYRDPSAGNTSMGIRLVMWENTVQMIKSSPILGAGSGSFYLDYADVVQGGEGWKYKVSDDPHNQYLHLWAEQGLPGLLLLLLFICVCFSTVPATSYGILAVFLLAGISATSLFNGHFSTFVEGRLFWVMLGVCLSGSTSPLSILRTISNK